MKLGNFGNYQASGAHPGDERHGVKESVRLGAAQFAHDAFDPHLEVQRWSPIERHGGSGICVQLEAFAARVAAEEGEPTLGAESRQKERPSRRPAVPCGRRQAEGVGLLDAVRPGRLGQPRGEKIHRFPAHHHLLVKGAVQLLARRHDPRDCWTQNLLATRFVFVDSDAPADQMFFKEFHDEYFIAIMFEPFKRKKNSPETTRVACGRRKNEEIKMKGIKFALRMESLDH